MNILSKKLQNSSMVLGCTLLLSCFASVQAQQQPLSMGMSPQKNFEAHANNKCPNEWKDYQADKRQAATPQSNDPVGLPNTPPEGKNGPMFDGGQGVETNPVGNMIRTKTSQDEGGVSPQTALSVPQGGPRPVTSTVMGETITSMTQPFLRPGLMTNANAARTTLNCRSKRNADPLGSTLAAAAPASNTESSPNQLWANLPITSNGASAVMMNAFGDQFLSASTNPAANALKAKADQQIKNMQNSDNQGNCARQNCESAFKSIVKPLINMANEDAAQQCKSDAANKKESNCIWMVQQMYKGCYIPMAILLLLPGATLTQVKAIVLSNWSQASIPDEDSVSPFVGLIRSMVAIFLIPATQLFISYTVDIGNALTDPIAQQIQAEEQALKNWVDEQAYASNPSNQDNCFKNVTGKQCQGKLMGTPSSSVVQERQSDLTVNIQNTLNTVNSMLSQGLNVLNAFQLVTMCYLFLLGPIAAALYAWPASVGSSGLFKNTLSSWIDGVVVLCLWKFWWCVILLCMVVRLEQGVDPSSQYEMYYYSAFMAILVMVPFAPFDCKPGDVVSSLLEKAQGSSGGGGGGGGGKSGSISGGSSSSRGGSTRPSGQQTTPSQPKTSNGGGNTPGQNNPASPMPGSTLGSSGNGGNAAVSVASNGSIRTPSSNDLSVSVTNVSPPPNS